MRRFGAVLLLAAATIACGQQVDPAAATGDLKTRAARVRAAAVAGNVDAALAELAALNDAVGFWRRMGALDESHADRIVAATAAVIRAIPLARQPEPTPTVRLEPPPPTRGDSGPDEKDEDNGDKGRGKRGKGGD